MCCVTPARPKRRRCWWWCTGRTTHCPYLLRLFLSDVSWISFGLGTALIRRAQPAPCKRAQHAGLHFVYRVASRNRRKFRHPNCDRSWPNQPKSTFSVQIDNLFSIDIKIFAINLEVRLPVRIFDFTARHVRSDHLVSRLRRPTMLTRISPRSPPVRSFDRIHTLSQVAVADVGCHHANGHAHEHSGRVGHLLRAQAADAHPAVGGVIGRKVGKLLGKR